MGGNQKIEDSRKRRIRLITFAVIIILILATISVAWYFNFRPWSIQELASKVVGPTGSPGFLPELANKTVQVAGTLTNVTEYRTTRGVLSELTLDHFGLLPLIQWNYSNHHVGEQVTIDVGFEWSACNDDVRVYSPEVFLLPGTCILMSIGVTMAAVCYVSGANVYAESAAGGKILVAIADVSDPVDLSDCNCTLRSGTNGGGLEYIDVLGYYALSGRPDVDSISNLSQSTHGQNGAIEFIDADSDDLLDAGDYFLLDGLRTPSTESGAYTYLMMIGRNSTDRFDRKLPDLICYIVNYKDGPDRILDSGAPYCRLSETHPSNDSVRLDVSNIGRSVEWSNVTSLRISNQGGMFKNCELLDNWSSNVSAAFQQLGCSFQDSVFPLDLEITVVDVQGDGMVDIGDHLILKAVNGTKFWNATELMTKYNETDLSQISGYRIELDYLQGYALAASSFLRGY